MPKQIAPATIKGTMERGRLHKRWRDELEEDLHVT
jgi:hypothetical protein